MWFSKIFAFQCLQSSSQTQPRLIDAAAIEKMKKGVIIVTWTWKARFYFSIFFNFFSILFGGAWFLQNPSNQGEHLQRRSHRQWSLNRGVASRPAEFGWGNARGSWEISMMNRNGWRKMVNYRRSLYTKRYQDRGIQTKKRNDRKQRTSSVWRGSEDATSERTIFYTNTPIHILNPEPIMYVIHSVHYSVYIHTNLGARLPDDTHT